MEHLALNIFHPGVRITKTACSGYVMTEGRLKISTPASRTSVLAGLRHLYSINWLSGSCLTGWWRRQRGRMEPDRNR